MNKEKVKILIWGVIISLLGYIVIDFISGYRQEIEIIEQAVELTERTNLSPYHQPSGTNVGDLAYDFELVDMEGNIVRLSDFRGQKVFLNFWASWCPPCRIEAPHLKSFHENNDENAVVLGVNVTTSESNIDNVEKFIDEFDLPFTNLYESNNISFIYNVMSMPTSYFIDSDGVIQDIAIGAVTEDVIKNRFSTIK